MAWKLWVGKQKTKIFLRLAWPQRERKWSLQNILSTISHHNEISCFGIGDILLQILEQTWHKNVSVLVLNMKIAILSC